MWKEDRPGGRKGLWGKEDESSDYRFCLDLWQIGQPDVTKVVLTFICTIKDERINIELCPQAFLPGKQMRMV